MVLTLDNYDGVYFTRFNDYNHCLKIDRELSKQYSIDLDGNYQVISCNISNQMMDLQILSSTNELVSTVQSDMGETSIIDIDAEGQRWEGLAYNQIPFGYGTLFNVDNCKIYEGFYFKDSMIGYGKLFYTTLSNVIEYEGTFYSGKKHGIGRLYDPNGSILYEGIWYMDKAVGRMLTVPSKSCSFDIIECGVEELVIDSYCFNDNQITKLTLYDVPLLSSLTIRDYSFMYVTKLTIRSCPCLKYATLSGFNGNEKIYKGIGDVVVKDCPQLKRLYFKGSSFTYFLHCILQRIYSFGC